MRFLLVASWLFTIVVLVAATALFVLADDFWGAWVFGSAAVFILAAPTLFAGDALPDTAARVTVIDQ
jgi:hypothetical protein